MTEIKLFSSIIDLFLPRWCPGCGRILNRGEGKLCVECISTLPRTEFYLHPNNPVYQKFIGRFDFEQALAFYYFQKSAAIQHIIHHFKYKNRKDIALFMGEQMGQLLLQSKIFKKPDGIVPVPLHPSKQRFRGYNQSELLGQGISKILNIPLFPKALQRITQTQTQTRLNAIERWQNVSSAFALSKKDLPETGHLLLIDDVVTSGATIEACARKLSEIEGVSISMAALATAIR